MHAQIEREESSRHSLGKAYGREINPGLLLSPGLHQTTMNISLRAATKDRRISKESLGIFLNLSKTNMLDEHRHDDLLAERRAGL